MDERVGTGGYQTMLDIEVVLMAGEALTLRVPDFSTGRVLRNMLRKQIPPNAGRYPSLTYKGSVLSLHSTLREQGLVPGDATLSCIYRRTIAYPAWCCLKKPDEMALDGMQDGVTKVEGIINLEQVRHLPDSLESLAFGRSFDHSLENSEFPRCLRSLTFGGDFNQSLENVKFPECLESLTFGRAFNQRLHRVKFPDVLQSLVFGNDFNQSLEVHVAQFKLPQGLQHLAFGCKFNQSLTKVQLPHTLQSLAFGYFFNQSLQDVKFPDGLQSLAFGDKFNQSLQNVNFPDGLQSLAFKGEFNQSLENVRFPDSLQSLAFGERSKQSLDNLIFPHGLQSLACGAWSFENVKFPDSLQGLAFGDEFNQSLMWGCFPESLQSLAFGDEFNQSLMWGCFPESLQSITFGRSFNQSLEKVNLPHSLQSLAFGHCFNQSLKNVKFPDSPAHLAFEGFNQSLLDVNFPDGLQSLALGDAFNQSLQDVKFPDGLQSLAFGDKFNQSLQNVKFPDGLQSLAFEGEFNQSLQNVKFPDGLQSLAFEGEFSQSLENVEFPDGLLSLAFGSFFNQSLLNVRSGLGRCVYSREPWELTRSKSDELAEGGARATEESELPEAVIPSTAYEVPSCPVCIERIDVSGTGLVTHSHGWIAEHQDERQPRPPTCTACAVIAATNGNGRTEARRATATLQCECCEKQDELWVCLICGHLGCGLIELAMPAPAITESSSKAVPGHEELLSMELDAILASHGALAALQEAIDAEEQRAKDLTTQEVDSSEKAMKAQEKQLSSARKAQQQAEEQLGFARELNQSLLQNRKDMAGGSTSDASSGQPGPSCEDRRSGRRRGTGEVGESSTTWAMRTVMAMRVMAMGRTLSVQVSMFPEKAAAAKGAPRAQFFDRCLRAERSVEYPRRQALPPVKISSFKPEVTVGSPRGLWHRATTNESQEPAKRNSLPGAASLPMEEARVKLSRLDTSMLDLVNQCRRVRLHPATTGLVRADREKLKLEYGFLTDERAEAITDTLKVTASEVREAHFRSNGLSALGAVQLLDALPEELESVDLSQNDLSNDLGWCRAVRRFTRLTSLTLSDCQLADGACGELLNNLIRCKIDLSRNGLSNGAAFQPLLKRFTQLQELDVHWNHFGGDAASLLQGIIDCSQSALTSLNLSWNPLGKFSAEDGPSSQASLIKTDLQSQILAEGLDENKSIVGLHVSGNEAHVDAYGSLVPRRGAKHSGGVNGTGLNPWVMASVRRGLLALCLLVAAWIHASSLCFKIPGITGPPMKRPKPRNKRQELEKCPQKGGIVMRVYTMSPKKPNSAIRKVCRLKLSTGVECIAYIPGRRRDLVGMRYCVIRISGPEATEVWVFTSIDGFSKPVKMQREQEGFAAYVMAAPGPLRFVFQVGTEILCSRTTPQVEVREMIASMRSGLGCYKRTDLVPEEGEGLLAAQTSASGVVLPEEEAPRSVDVAIFSSIMVVQRPADESPVSSGESAFRVTLEAELKDPGTDWPLSQGWGLVVSSDEALRELVIVNIQESTSVKHWNLEHPECPIEVGQAILEVNGKTERNEMLEELWGKTAWKDRVACGAVIREVAINETIPVRRAQEWCLESSLFAPHWEPLSGKQFRERCFKVDWQENRIYKLIPDEAERSAVRELLREHYAEMKVLYGSLCSVDWKTLHEGSKPISFGIGLYQYSHMLVQHNLDFSKSLEAYQTEGRLIHRHGFFGLLVRLAVRYATGTACKSLKGRFNPTQPVKKALQYLFAKHLMPFGVGTQSSAYASQISSAFDRITSFLGIQPFPSDHGFKRHATEDRARLGVGMTLGGLLATGFAATQLGGCEQGDPRFSPEIFFLLAAATQAGQGAMFVWRSCSTFGQNGVAAPQTAGDEQACASEKGPMPRVAKVLMAGCFVVYATTYTMPTLMPFMAGHFTNSTESQQLLLWMQVLQNAGDVLGRLATALVRENRLVLTIWMVLLVASFLVSVLTSVQDVSKWFQYQFAILAMPLTCGLFYFSRGLLVTTFYLYARGIGPKEQVQEITENMGFCGQMGALIANFAAFVLVSIFT
eukprot:g26149.t2